jgi:hypothetical protein
MTVWLATLSPVFFSAAGNFFPLRNPSVISDLLSCASDGFYEMFLRIDLRFGLRRTEPIELFREKLFATHERRALV